MRSTWLKKAYDELKKTPNLFGDELAFVKLGVGKNMAQSIRFWGRVCGVFEPHPQGNGYRATELGEALLEDDGWDPFLVGPESWWLLHWHLVAHRETAFTWYYTFNHLRGGEFTVPSLISEIYAYLRTHGWNEPSPITLERDIDCMIRCYLPPSAKANTPVAEDLLLCPLSELGLLQQIPGHRAYRFISETQPTLPTALVAYAILQFLNPSGSQESAFQRRTVAFNDLAYAPELLGRVFRLDEDSLLQHLLQLHDVTRGAAYYTDQAGIRQVAWEGDLGPTMAQLLLGQVFNKEQQNG